MNHVLLMSPGVDSFVSYCLLTEHKKRIYDKDEKLDCVYFDIKGKYSDFEIRFLKERLSAVNVEIKNLEILKWTEHEDAHVPNRNLIFCTLAQSLYNADYIYLNSTLCDRSEDGTESFRTKTSVLLSELAGKEVKVISILDKQEKIYWYQEIVKLGVSPITLLENTFSCFNPLVQNHIKYKISDADNKNLKPWITYGECLNCPACFRKMVGMCSIGVYIPFYNKSLVNKYVSKIDDQFKKDYPLRSKYILEYSQFLKQQGLI